MTTQLQFVIIIIIIIIIKLIIIFFFVGSIWFRVTTFPKGTSRSQSFRTPYSARLLCRSDQPSQTPLHYNTQKSKQTNNRAPNGIRTDNASKWAAPDPLLRPCGHRHRRRTHLDTGNFKQTEVSDGLNNEKTNLRLWTLPRIIQFYAWSHFQTQEEEMRPVSLTKSSVLMSEIFVVVFKFLQICVTDIIHIAMKDVFV